jgi:hypothetical protein
VSKLQSSELKHTYWGIENLNPEKNIWGVEIPEIVPEDQLKVRVTIECPNCSARDFLRADESLLATLQEKGGTERTCQVCKKPGLWKLLPYWPV